jgi:hypothetical protein
MKVAWFSVYNLVLALWVGGIAIFTFIVTPAIFRSFGKDLAGEIVGKLFPGYFIYTLVLTLLALFLFLLANREALLPDYRLSLSLLLLSVAVSLFVAFWVHPTTVDVKKTIASFEQGPSDTPAKKRFARLHALSASLNLLLLADGIVLLVVAPGLKK